MNAYITFDMIHSSPKPVPCSPFPQPSIAPFFSKTPTNPIPNNSEESLLALRTLGLQTRTLSPCYLLPATTRFIPTTQIRDLFIHEAFRGFEVRHYLAVVVKEEKDVVVVFPVSLVFVCSLSEWKGREVYVSFYVRFTKPISYILCLCRISSQASRSWNKSGAVRGLVCTNPHHLHQRAMVVRRNEPPEMRALWSWGIIEAVQASAGCIDHRHAPLVSYFLCVLVTTYVVNSFNQKQRRKKSLFSL